MTWTAWLITFFALFLADLCWVHCVRHVRDDSALGAALWAVALFLPTAVGVINFTTDHWLLVPAVLGTFCGTATGVLWRPNEPH